MILECYSETDVVVRISRIVVVTIRSRIVVSIIVVIASSIGTRIVRVGSFNLSHFLIYNSLYKKFVLQALL